MNSAPPVGRRQNTHGRPIIAIFRSRNLNLNERRLMFDPIQRWEYEGGSIAARRHRPIAAGGRKIWFSSGTQSNRAQRGFASRYGEESEREIARVCGEDGPRKPLPGYYAPLFRHLDERCSAPLKLSPSLVAVLHDSQKNVACAPEGWRASASETALFRGVSAAVQSEQLGPGLAENGLCAFSSATTSQPVPTRRFASQRRCERSVRAE